MNSAIETATNEILILFGISGSTLIATTTHWYTFFQHLLTTITNQQHLHFVPQLFFLFPFKTTHQLKTLLRSASRSKVMSARSTSRWPRCWWTDGFNSRSWLNLNFVTTGCTKRDTMEITQINRHMRMRMNAVTMLTKTLFKCRNEKNMTHWTIQPLICESRWTTPRERRRRRGAIPRKTRRHSIESTWSTLSI